MSLSDRPAPRAGDLPLAIGVLVALFASVVPLLRVVSPGPWLFGVLAVSACVLGTGYLARLRRLPAVAVSLIEAGVWAALISLIFLRDTSLLGVIPTPDTVDAVTPMLQSAAEQIQLGVAPLAASQSLAFLIVGATGALAVILDHVVITARLPLVAAVGLIAVSLIASIAVPADVDLPAFALLAASILFLVRVETRTRQERGPAAAPVAAAPRRTSSTTATAVSIGAIAVVVAVVVTPLLPAPQARAGGDLGIGGVAINPTLRLGDDLRRPREQEVLTVRSTAPSPPYLRVVTLSSFNGRIWQPDRRDTTPIEGGAGFGAVQADGDVTLEQYTTHVQISGLQTQWLPVPFPAVGVSGLDAQWSVMPYNRTVIGATTTTSGLSYDVTSEVPKPTLEQIRALPAANVDIDGGFDQSSKFVPGDVSDDVALLARQVTSGAPSDYDKLIALQSWFRGPDFTYSLDAPVEQGFDGSGVRAVTQFLQVKEGYCVHFASAFALMARTLGMSSRIVVGYLPGTTTSTTTEDQTIYSVSSSQLHAWPEVYFQGLGWVPFEPTKSLGTPTSFAPASVTGGNGTNNADPSLGPSAGSTASPSIAAGLDDPGLDQGASGTAESQSSPLPWVILIGILIALLVPALTREIRRRQLMVAARGGDAAAAWTSVQDVAIDIGVPVPGSETPRTFGARLVTTRGVPAAEMQVLVSGIERASYAPGGLSRVEGRAVADAASRVRLALLASIDTAPRLAALLLPRSLVIRPGSMYAGAKVSVTGR